MEIIRWQAENKQTVAANPLKLILALRSCAMWFRLEYYHNQHVWRWPKLKSSKVFAFTSITSMHVYVYKGERGVEGVVQLWHKIDNIREKLIKQYHKIIKFKVKQLLASIIFLFFLPIFFLCSFKSTCICTSSSVLIRLEASLSLPSPRWPHNESISSTKMIEGALSRAIWKRFETSFSLSPIHFETRSEEETLHKSSSWHLPTYWRKLMNIIRNKKGK